MTGNPYYSGWKCEPGLINLRNDMERKPYYVIRINDSGFKLHEGDGHGGNTLQLYLTDEEVQKYNPKAVTEILRPYIEITMKRYLNVPVELIIYAICEVLYD